MILNEIRDVNKFNMRCIIIEQLLFSELLLLSNYSLKMNRERAGPVGHGSEYIIIFGEKENM